MEMIRKWLSATGTILFRHNHCSLVQILAFVDRWQPDMLAQLFSSRRSRRTSVNRAWYALPTRSCRNSSPTPWLHQAWPAPTCSTKDPPTTTASPSALSSPSLPCSSPPRTCCGMKPKRFQLSSQKSGMTRAGSYEQTCVRSVEKHLWCLPINLFPIQRRYVVFYSANQFLELFLLYVLWL